MSVRRGFRRLKRLVWLGAIAGAVVGVRRWRAAREAKPSVGAPATWPPLQPSEEPVAAVGDLVTDDGPAPSQPPEPEVETGDEPVAALGDLVTDDARWVAPIGGGCPLSHPIKANLNSMIYHRPGGRFYDRTQAERCYADPADAEADGYRAARGA